MSRALTAAMLAEIVKQTVSPVLFWEAEFASGTTRLWSGIGTIAWNSQTWTGAGQLLNVGAIAESAAVNASGVQVQVSGLSTTVAALALTQARQGKKCSIWLGMLDSAGSVIADPVLVFSGLLDVPEINETGQDAAIAFNYESRLITLKTPNLRRYTKEDQQKAYPGDTGFHWVAKLQDALITW